jgi:hypothetical protein
MAQGGRPGVGEPVLVGERGPEVFVPNMPGAIMDDFEVAEATYRAAGFVLAKGAPSPRV